MNIKIEHILLFLLLLILLINNTKFCQKICNNGFRVGGQDYCQSYFNNLAINCSGIGPDDNPDSKCCNGSGTIKGLNMLSRECSDSLIGDELDTIQSKFNYCHNNFPRIFPNNYYAVFLPMNNGTIPLEHINFRNKLNRESYEVLSGSDNSKANRLHTIFNFYKDTDMLYHESSNVEKFTVGGQIGVISSISICDGSVMDCLEWIGAIGAVALVIIFYKGVQDCLGCGDDDDLLANQIRLAPRRGYLSDQQLDDLLAQQQEYLDQQEYLNDQGGFLENLQRPPGAYTPEPYTPPVDTEHPISITPASGHGIDPDEPEEPENVKDLRDRLKIAEEDGNTEEVLELMEEIASLELIP